MKAREILAGLGLEDVNPGCWSGDGGWLADKAAPVFESVNPATGEVIARVRGATAADYERIAASATAAFAEWRKVPAPQRGEGVGRVGEALRDKKDLLGSLVTLEIGKFQLTNGSIIDRFTLDANGTVKISNFSDLGGTVAA